LFIRAKHLFVGANIPEPEIVQFDYAQREDGGCDGVGA
jgi:hypothetical protein